MSIHINSQRAGWLGIASVVAVGVMLLSIALVESAKGADRPASLMLGAGRIGPYEWSARVVAPRQSKEREEGVICLGMTFLEVREGSEFAVCGPWMPGAPVVETFRGGTRQEPGTAVAMLFDGGAKKVYLKLAGRPGRTLPLKPVVPEELGISAKPLSSFARGYGGRFCIERYVAYGVGGHVVADSGRRRCAHG